MAGPASVFNGANRELARRGKPPFYRIDFVSAAGGGIASSAGVAVETRRIADRRRRGSCTLLVVGAEREALLRAVADPAIRSALPPLAADAERFCPATFGTGPVAT